MGKIGLFFVALALLGAARCYNSDMDTSGLPIIGAKASAKAPAYVSAMGTPAAVTLPEIDFTKWFSQEAAEGVPADAYSPTTWGQVDAFFAVARTQAGWTEACKKATEAAGAERATKPEIGALACSSDPAVTPIQRFAVQILGVRAEVALWIRGVPGHGRGGVSGRQGELRLMCAVDVIAREGGADSAYARACTLALDTSYTTGDNKATFDALGQAYTLVATEIASRDPKTAAEPAYYATASEQKQ